MLWTIAVILIVLWVLGLVSNATMGGFIHILLVIAIIVLIAAGILGLVYGGFSYTSETHEAKLGPIELSVKDKQRVNVPVWAGVAAIVAGGAILVLGGRKG